MATDLLYGLLPDHILLGLMLVLMLFEMFRADAGIARILFAAAVLGACAILLHQLAAGYAADIVPGEIRVDRFALYAKLVILGSGLALGLAFPAGGTYKFWFLLSSSLLGALIMMDSAGFVSLFIGIEMLSLPAFALMVHGCGGSASAEGAFKYLLLSSVATALLLFGISLSYGSTGTLAIESFARAALSGRPQDMAAGILVMSGLFLKAAVFPFHGWAPDAYASTRIQVTALLASIVKGSVVLALVRIVSTATLDAALVLVVAVLAILSIYYGNIAAINQRSFKRLLAYSSIAHAGYMIFALVDSTQSRAEDLLWYVGIYALTTVIACASFSALCPGDGDDLQSLDGGYAARPAAALLLAFAVLSLAGIPPFPGFFAKLFIFKSVIASGFLVPAVIAFAGSFIGLVYYLGIVVRLFKMPGPVAAAETEIDEAPAAARFDMADGQRA